MAVYYLSDTSFDYFARVAKNSALSVGDVIEEGVRTWPLRNLKVDLPADIVQLIEVRAEEVERRISRSALARGDKRRRTVSANALYDGVAYRIVFGGSGRRRARQFTISYEVEKQLATWLRVEGVVRRRAASQRTLAGCALELLGRGWTSGTGSEEIGGK